MHIIHNLVHIIYNHFGAHSCGAHSLWCTIFIFFVVHNIHNVCGAQYSYSLWCTLFVVHYLCNISFLAYELNINICLHNGETSWSDEAGSLDIA